MIVKALIGPAIGDQLMETDRRDSRDKRDNRDGRDKGDGVARGGSTLPLPSPLSAGVSFPLTVTGIARHPPSLL